MSQMPREPGRRAWWQQRQWRAIVIAAAPMIVAILVVWLSGRPFGPHAAPAAAPPSPLPTSVRR
jgi:hypothetical protein